jgi:hypothetical protein
MAPMVGRLVLIASGLGFPLTQLALVRFGRRGAVLVEGVTAGLLVRDAALVAAGAPGRLLRYPALLLYAETAVAAAAAASSLPLVISPSARERVAEPSWTGWEALRRVVIGTLFGLHTLRFRIYLQPGHGLRGSAAA